MTKKLKKLTGYQLFLPLVCVLLVLAVNVFYDISQGNDAFNFFHIYMNNGMLQGRLVTILNRGSEVAILSIGMTLVVAASAGTDISVGSVMSLCASFCCMLIAGFSVSSVSSADEFAMPMIVGLLGALVMGCLCGAFNGALVAGLNIQPMVATLILWSAARAIGLLLCNNLIVYIRVPEYGILGGYVGPFPTPILIAAICVAVATILLKTTALGMYIQAVGINKKASRIAGLNSKRIIFLCYLLCGLCAGIAGIVASSRITSADSNNIGLDMELDAILAVALGGNSLGGGRFNLAGSIVGAYTIQAITTTMYNLGVSTAVNPVFKAVIVILIVAIQAPPVRDALRKFNARRAAKKEAVHV